MPSSGTPLPQVYFDDEYPLTNLVTFQVDLEYAPCRCLITNVEARGSFQVPHPWTGGFTLTNNAAGPNPWLYSGAYNVPRAPDTVESYKFIYQNTSSGDVHWEDDPNRSFTLAVNSQTLPVQLFNNVSVPATKPPQIVYCLTNLTLSTTSSNCQALLPDLTGTNYILAVGTCSSVTVTQNPPPGAWLGLGANPVTMTAVDACGNSSVCTFTVTIPDSRTISTSSSPPGGGSTSGGGTVGCGSNVTLCATANSCYNFVNWTEGTHVVSATSCYTFMATSNRTLVANFAPVTYTITTVSEPSAGGGVTRSPEQASYASGTQVTLTAVPKAGYLFATWWGDINASTNPLVITVSTNITVHANFARIAPIQNYTNRFDTASDATSWTVWWGPPNPMVSWDSATDAGGNPSSGSLKVSEAFTGAAGEQFAVYGTLANRWLGDNGLVLDCTRYANLVFDLKVDPGTHPSLNNDYGPLEPAFVTLDWNYVPLGTYHVPLSATNWTHVVQPINPALPGLNRVIGIGFHMWSSGTFTNTLTFRVDNLTLQVTPGSQITLADTRKLTDGSFQFAFTNAPGAPFSVLTATNLALPLSNWTPLTGLNEDTPGQFRFTDPEATNLPQRFYRVRSP